jgi:hypothetical protein
MSIYDAVGGSAYGEMPARNQVDGDVRYGQTYNPQTSNRDKLGSEDPKIGHRAIPQAVAQMEKDLYLLGETLNELRNRLGPVMRPESPQVEQEQEQEKQHSPDVPMVAAIAMATRMIRSITGTAQDLVKRLEI